MTTRRATWIVVAIIGVYFALCARALDDDFVWDDVTEIARSPAFDGPFLDGIRATQAERIDPTLAHSEGISLAYDSYRPVLFASYWLETHAWGRGPGLMHADNLLLGAIGIVLAYLLARRLIGDPLGLVVTGIFALHPLHVEAVVYISGRGDLLAGVLALATALLALRARDAARLASQIAWAGAAALAFAASLLSKESCIGLPVAVIAIGWTTGARARQLWIPLALTAVAAIVMTVRASVIATSSHLAIADAVIRIPGITLLYLRSTVLPFDLSTERPLDSSLLVVGWIVIGVVVVAGAYTIVRRGSSRALPAELSGLVWSVVLIAPTSVAIFTTGVASDRYMYAPLFGFAVVLVCTAARLVRRFPSMCRVAIGVGIAWALVTTYVTWRQVSVWSDDLALDEHAIAMVPDSGAAHWRLGSIYAQVGRWDDARGELETSVALDPKNFHALDNLGVVDLRLGRPADAERVLVQAIEASPRRLSFRPQLNLGLAQLALGKSEEGCAAIRRALLVRPGYEAAVQAIQRSCSPTARHTQAP